MTTEIQRKAQELADQVNAQIQEARTDLAIRMVEKGYVPDQYKICDNLLDVIEGLTLSYRCWAELKHPLEAKQKKPKSKRGKKIVK